MNKLEKLIKLKEELTSTYHKRQKVIETQMKEERIPELSNHNKEWYQQELEQILPLIETENMGLEDKYPLEKVKYTYPIGLMNELKTYKNLTTAVVSTVVGDDVSEEVITENTRNLEVSEYSNISMDELQQIKAKEETLPVDSLKNHINLAKNLSVKASYLAGSYAINAALTSIGLPPITGLKYIAIGGVKVAGILTGAAINFGVQNPGKAVAIVGNLPIAYTYAEKAIKNLKTKEESPVTPATTDTTAVPNPVVDKSIVESHSIYDFFELIGQITWKVLKKIESLF